MELEQARKFNVERFLKTHPDALKNAKLTFLIPNEYWQKNPDKCDVLGLDAKDSPIVKELPKLGIPYQIVKYKGKDYLADKNGKFKPIGAKERKTIAKEPKQVKKELINRKEIEAKIKKGEKLSYEIQDKLPEDLKKKYNNKQDIIRIQNRHIEDTEEAIRIAEQELEGIKGTLSDGIIHGKSSNFHYETKKRNLERKIKELKESLEFEKNQLLKIKGIKPKPKKPIEKVGIAEKLVKNQINKSKIRSRYKEIKERQKNPEDWEINQGGMEGIMSKDHIAMYSTKDDFEKTHLASIVKDAKETNLEDQYVVISGAFGLYQFAEGSYGSAYPKEYIDDAMKILDNPKVFYKKGVPLILKDKKYVYMIAPRSIDEEDIEVDISGDIDVPNAIMSYKEYNNLSKKYTKKELLEKIKKINPDFYHNGKGYQKYKDFYLGEYVKARAGVVDRESSVKDIKAKIQKVSPTDTKEVVLNGKKLKVLASTWEDDFKPLTEKNKKEMDNYLRNHPELKISDHNARDYHPYIQNHLLKKGKTPQSKKVYTKKNIPSILPKLKDKEKYYMTYVDQGVVRHIGYTTNPQKAINDLNKERKISKKLGVKSKVELFVAKDIYDVREQVHARGRSDYLITGDTYKNKNKIHNIARVKFDYNTKGYRGKLSPSEVAELRSLSGIIVEKSKEFTPEEQKLSREIRADTKATRWEKQSERLKQSGTAKMDKAKQMRDMIPMGQPILVGHHSETRHRKHLDRMNKMDSKGYEELKKSKKLQQKADTIRKSTQYKKGDAERRRQAYRDKITPELIQAKKDRKKVYSHLHSRWYDIEKVNKKTITVKAETGDYTFTIDKSFIKQIERKS